MVTMSLEYEDYMGRRRRVELNKNSGFINVIGRKPDEDEIYLYVIDRPFSLVTDVKPLGVYDKCISRFKPKLGKTGSCHIEYNGKEFVAREAPGSANPVYVHRLHDQVRALFGVPLLDGFKLEVGLTEFTFREEESH